MEWRLALQSWRHLPYFVWRDRPERRSSFYRGVEKWLSRKAHNLEIVCSSHTAANCLDVCQLSPL